MPHRTLVSLSAVMAAAAFPVPAAADLPEVVDRAAGSVVGIEVTPADVRPPALHRFGVGFAFDPHGHVVTTSELVDGALGVRVRLEDGRRVEARVVGSDRLLGVAVLEIAPRAPALPLGRPDLARLGEPVAAVTRDEAGRLVVRAGVLSARGGSSSAIVDDDLEPDFEVLPAELAGAPLLDGAGRVLGMLAPRPPAAPPTARRRGAPGVRIALAGRAAGPRLAAVPVDAIGEAVRQIVERGRVDWPWLGLALQETSTVAGTRIEVVSTAPGSPGASAGVAPGDLVVSIDGRRVRRVTDVQRGVLARRAGQRVTLVVERGGQSQTLELVVQVRPREDDR